MSTASTENQADVDVREIPSLLTLSCHTVAQFAEDLETDLDYVVDDLFEAIVNKVSTSFQLAALDRCFWDRRTGYNELASTVWNRMFKARVGPDLLLFCRHSGYRRDDPQFEKRVLVSVDLGSLLLTNPERAGELAVKGGDFVQSLSVDGVRLQHLEQLEGRLPDLRSLRLTNALSDHTGALWHLVSAIASFGALESFALDRTRLGDALPAAVDALLLALSRLPHLRIVALPWTGLGSAHVAGLLLFVKQCASGLSLDLRWSQFSTDQREQLNAEARGNKVSITFV